MSSIIRIFFLHAPNAKKHIAYIRGQPEIIDDIGKICNVISKFLATAQPT
ncbi:MAG: hypothetical protein ABIR03_11590 [Ginsengibacter sp.]